MPRYSCSVLQSPILQHALLQYNRSATRTPRPKVAHSKGLNSGEAEFAPKAASGAFANQVSDFAKQAGNIYRLDKHGVFSPGKIGPGVLVGGENCGGGFVVHHFGVG